MSPRRPLARPQRSLTPHARLAILARLRFDRRRALAVALLAGVALVIAQTLAAARATTAALGTTTPVVVAVRDLAPGHLVGDDDVTVEQWPVALVDADTPGDPAAVVGSFIRSATWAGEVVHLSRLGPGRFSLLPDERAFTLPLSLAPPPVQPGDSVELIGVSRVGDGDLVAARVLGAGRVVVSDDGGVTVAVSASMVTVLAETVATGAVEIAVAP